MTRRISPEGRHAREKMRLVSQETERLIERILKGDVVISGETLSTQVALNLGLPVQEVKPIVATYTYTRTDLTLKYGWHGTGKNRWYGEGIGRRTS